MKQNKLLQRQVKKLLPPELAEHSDLQKFLQAVSDSYQAYERDNELAARAFSISEEEYISINDKLTREIQIREQSVAHLKEMAGIFTDGKSARDYDDLLLISRYLGQQMKKRKNAEKVFTSLITNLQSGILLENEERKIVFCNQLFNDMFGIPLPPEVMTGADCTNSAEQSKALFKEPQQFVDRINEILSLRKLVTGEELELADGRVLERDYIPIWVDNHYEGHLWNYTDITERKRATETLEKSEQTNRLILNSSLDAIVIIDKRGAITYWNRQAEKVFGWTEADVLGKTLSQTIIPSSFRQLHDKGMRRYNESGEGPVLNKVIEVPAVDIHGNEISVELSIVPVHKDGETFFCGYIRDISERKKSENELKRLSLVASANKNAVLFTKPDASIFWCNEGFCQLTGFSQEETMGKTPVELLKGPQTDRQSLQEMISLFTEGKNFDIELICHKKDGTPFWSRTTGQSVFDDNGNLLQYFAMVEDITLVKEAQLQQKNFETRFRKALEKIGDNVWEHDFRTGETWFSGTSDHLLGFTEKSSVDNAAKWWQQTHPEDRPMLEDNHNRYATGQATHHTLEYRVVTGDGTVRWVLDRGVVIEQDAAGKPLRVVGTHTDITERKLSEQALQVNEEKYRSIIANMNLGLLEVDNEEKIQYANQSFCEMSGFSVDELIGKKASLLFVRGENQEIVETKNEMRKHGHSDLYEIAVKNKRGELKWWLISGAPRFNDKGELLGSIGIHLDITSQKKLELELYDAREAAEESARAKETFLANMSHEIRTPMNAILGMGKQLTKSELNDQQRFYLDTINKAADHLLVVINDILDISKIEAGKMNLEQIGFRPDEVIHHCMRVMNHRAEEKGLQLLKEDGDLQYPVFIGDPFRLTQVLLNMISNAIKFTEKGSVTIHCSLLPRERNIQSLRISVKDTGIGMDEEFTSNLFQKFTQEDKTTARKYGGTGLGMSITKQLVELMKGTIDVESAKGSGTTVTINIPFLLGEETDLPGKTTITTDSSILKNKRILLVEDNEMNRLVAATVLEPYGVLLNEVTNGKEAVEELRQSRYDLVLMDMQMPVMNGLEATTIIRSEIDAQMPIIALTANAIKGESDRCLQAGMNDYVSKPFEEENLVAVMAQWLSKHEKKTSTLINSNPMNTAQNTPLYDLSKLRKIGNGNTGFIEKMVQLFTAQVPAAVSDIRIALTEGKTETVKSLAHRIKPSLDNMGISSLYQVIRDIEKHDSSDSLKAALENNVEKLEQTTVQVVQQLYKAAGQV